MQKILFMGRNSCDMPTETEFYVQNKARHSSQPYIIYYSICVSYKFWKLDAVNSIYLSGCFQ